MKTPSRRTRVIVVCGAIAAVGGALAWPSAPVRGIAQVVTVATPEPAVDVFERPGPARLGSGSCAASNCHGSIAVVPGLPVLGNEHTTWIGDDAHARAYQVLLEPRSERIARNLAGAGEVVPAHRDPRCLACHSTPRPEPERMATTWMDADGVGCEACHGPARDWIGPHTTAAWQAIPPGQKPGGFRELDDPYSRARLCTACHIGERDAPDGVVKDVNHDLIAAGHPRLDFEYAAYQDRMPAHWAAKGEEASADYPARAWLAGQLVALGAMLDLTRSRAESAEAPWPEFSEYGCAGCHHDLTYRSLPVVSAGTYDWASWHVAGARGAIALAAGAEASTSLNSALEKLAAVMNRPLPDRMEAAAAATAVREEVRAIGDGLGGAAIDTATLRDWFAQLETRGGRNGPTAWDREAQRYLGLVPLYQAWVRLGGDASELGSLRERIEALRAELERRP